MIHEHLGCLSSRVGQKAVSRHPVCRNHAIPLAMGVSVAVLPQCPTAYPSLTRAYLHLLLVTQPQTLGCFSKCVASRLREEGFPPYSALMSFHLECCVLPWLPGARQTRTYWRECGGGPPRWPRGWSTRCGRRGRESWACAAVRRDG